MSPMRAFILFYTRSFDFKGRSRRAEFWWMQLLFIVIFAVGTIFIGATGSETDLEGEVHLTFGGILFMGILLLWGIISVIPGIALNVRRFHDLDQTGWLVLLFAILNAIPLFGFLIWIGQMIWFAMPGTNGPNKFGSDPKDANPADVFA